VGFEAQAPELDVAGWRNAPSGGLQLAKLQGQVVVLYAFQMLCPGCVLHGTPLAKRIHELFSGSGVTVIGLHTVFEHHQAMTPDCLDVYLSEFQVRFPVGIDRQTSEGLPATMRAYEMNGTPTFVLIDQSGHVRQQFFGVPNELALGVAIGRLLVEG
jgi:peroxiredoxin